MPDGFELPRDAHGKVLVDRPAKPKSPIRIHSVDELKAHIGLGYRVQDLDVRGDIHRLLHSSTATHPVVSILHERKRLGSKPGRRADPHRVAIAIEGGGMRGCVAAGMITAFWHLGLQDAVDVIYGSSAGSLVGAYFIAGQMPHFGPEVYYDALTAAAPQFMDPWAILHACGLGLLDLRPRSLWRLLTTRMGTPVLDLHYLFDTVVRRSKPLDWQAFWRQQTQGTLPLKIVASGLLSRQAVVLSAEGGHFTSLHSLAQCMTASMLLPGITGDAVRLQGTASEPMADALLFEPVPYRSALREGCSHVVALRTRADDTSVTQRMGAAERMIMHRFFARKLRLPELRDWMTNQHHKLIYAEDMLRINAANRDLSNDSSALYGIAMPAGVPEIGRMERRRAVIFENVRQGFAAAYDSLVLDPALRGKGCEVAQQIWPDAILLQPQPPM